MIGLLFALLTYLIGLLMIAALLVFDCRLFAWYL